MDLGVCPGCGRKWPGGEHCPNCGFIPIGAGLTRLPKKKKRKIRPYREPGSSTPLLLFLALFGASTSVYQSKPWDDGWDKVRSVLGHPRIHSIEGTWQVVKTMELKPEEPGAFAAIEGASMAFNGTRLSMTLVKAGQAFQASGGFEVEGTTVRVSSLHGEAADGPDLPKALSLSLAWNGEDRIVATTGPTEVIDLERGSGAVDKPGDLERDQLTQAYLADEENPRGSVTKTRDKPK